MNATYPAHLSLEHFLMNSKHLEPLPPDLVRLLQEVEQLDVSSFSEADVRAEVIDPIIRALGYKKQTPFSTEREKRLKVLDGNLFPDYSMLVLEENFWIIEAKKVLRAEKRFSADELKQALVYAAHPDVNAALIVLCDGRIIQVFDREMDLSTPVLSIEIEHLVRDFEKLRELLGPWQAWFFQKRRTLRLLDKVFDREINMNRLDEFRRLVDSRLSSKRSRVLENARAIDSRESRSSYLKHLASLSPRELVDIHFFRRPSIEQLDVIAKSLVTACQASSFEILRLIFPEDPRDANERYWGAALHFLLELEVTVPEVGWLPEYLADVDHRKSNTSSAAERLISLCLTGFQARPGEQIVLLHSAAARRIAKQSIVMHPEAEAIASQRHALLRHHINETADSQFISSPEGQLLHALDEMEMLLSQQFVQDQRSPSERFHLDKAKQALRDTWGRELFMLGDGRMYREARKARGNGEILPTEAVSVVYDQLGHYALCIVNRFPKWQEYVRSHHALELERLARFGSWAAKEALGASLDTQRLPSPTLDEIADRFFLGDKALCLQLAKGYGYELIV